MCEVALMEMNDSTCNLTHSDRMVTHPPCKPAEADGSKCRHNGGKKHPSCIQVWAAETHNSMIRARIYQNAKSLIFDLWKGKIQLKPVTFTPTFLLT